MPDPLFESLVEEFLMEGRERIDRVEALLLDLDTAPRAERDHLRNEARRELHTLKGNAAMMGLSELQQYAHGLEDEVERLDLGAVEVGGMLRGVDEFRALLDAVAAPKDESGGSEEARTTGLADAEHLSESVRVPFTALDQLVEQLQETVIFRNRLRDVLDRHRSSAKDDEVDAWDEARDAEAVLHRTLERMQQDIMQLRLVPLKTLFRHLQRVVHDEGANHAKQVVLETSGGETPLDKGLLEVANDALGHLVRNAVIHGIEDPELRRERGKPTLGTVRLAARVEAEEVEIEVADDGGGIDREALREAASAKGLELEAESRVDSLVFTPGLTTRQQADLSAGRGMGLSAVVESVERQSGRVEVESTDGEGSRFTLRLPLTVSVTQALLLASDGQEYALPFSAVVESRTYDPEDLHLVNHTSVMRWRDRFIPLVDLGCYFGTCEALRLEGDVVVVDVAGQPRALLADAVVETRDIVVKGLDAICGSPPGVSGSTILGDGRVVLILDPARIGELATSE